MTPLRLALITVGGTLVYLGLAVLGSGGFAALTLVPLTARIRPEEALLRSFFGVAYERSCGRNSRLIPGPY